MRRHAAAFRDRTEKNFVHPLSFSVTMFADLIGGRVMDWKLAIKEERAALKRIVALLFALADLAQSVSRRSPRVRRFVIWVLRQAEIVAWDLVIGQPEAPAPMPPSLFSDSLADPDEAMRLALSFRDLARELRRQAKFAFAAQDRIDDDAGQSGLARFGAFRLLDTHNFLNAFRRLAVVLTARRAAYATGPPDDFLFMGNRSFQDHRGLQI